MTRSSAADADLSVPALLARARARRSESRPRLAHISASMLALARQRLAPRSPLPGSAHDPFKPATPFPGAIPRGHTLAMDESVTFQAEWAAASYSAGAAAFSSAWQEGTVFPGYPFLASLAQRPEYRRLSEVIGTEMTRRWIRFGSSGGDDKTERIAELTDELDRLETRDRFRALAEIDGYFGRSHLYLDTGSTDDRDELRTPIGDGRGSVSRAKFGGRRRFLRALRTVEPYWVYPTNYDSNDPLRGAWYEPEQWYVMGKEVHASRLLRFVGREVPDMLKPAYSFGGLSMSQMALPYVNNWLRTRQSVADIVHAFSVFVLATNMSETLGPDGDQLFARLELFNLCRDNRGVMAIDKDAEQFQNVSAPLGGLHELQAQTQEHMSSVSGIPVVKLLGITPSGLNASSDGEMRAFYDWVRAFQEKLFRPNLTRVIDFAMLSLWGEVDQDITFEFEPLWALDEKGEAEVNQIKATTGAALVEGGIVSQEEERRRVASDPSSGYDSLDAEALPDLREEEEGGLVPEGGGRVSAELAGGRAEKEGEIDDPRGGTPAESGGGEDNDDGPLHKNFLRGKNPLSPKHLEGKNPLSRDFLKTRVAGKREAGDDSGGPFATDEAPFKEDDHPRDKSGKFGSGGGSFGATPQSHLDKVKSALSAKVKGGSAERVALRKLLKETTSSELRKEITQKIVESFLKQHDSVKHKNPTKAAEIEGKLQKLGHKMGGPTVAPPNATPQQKAEASSNYTADETASFDDLKVMFGSENAAKNYFSDAKAKIAAFGLPLTPGEGAHISAYTGSAYRATNAALRAGVMDESRWNHVNRLNAALEKLPPYVGTSRRRADLTPEQQKLYQPGMIIEERGFCSTSKNSNTWSGDVVFDIQGKTGRDISKISQHPGEAEVLFRSGTRFRVKSNSGDKIVLEEVGR